MEFEEFCSILTRVLEKPKKVVLPTSTLSNDLGLCSFDMMILLGEIHAATGLNVKYEAMKKDMTVDDLLKALV